MPREPRLRWADVRLLYVREMRSALRERNIVVHSLLIPIFLYPVVLWVAYTLMAFVGGQTAGQPSRVHVSGLPESHRAFSRQLATETQIELVLKAPEDAARAIQEGKLDVFVELLPAPPSGAFDDNARVRLTYDKSKDRSSQARQRVADAVDRYRRQVVDAAARRIGLDAAGLQGFWIDTRNVATARDMGRFLLGLMLPFFLVLMLAIGAFYPAIDSTAGEREHSTWETAMTLATPRAGIVVAKYLYVATLSTAAGLLNLAAMTLSMKSILKPLLGDRSAGLSFGIPLSAIPVILLGTVLLALVVSAAMMILASFARTFKEGQAMVSPFYVGLVIPLMFLVSPGLELTPKLALIPIVNVAMMFREAIAGTYNWPLIGLTLAAQAATIGALLWLATRILGQEDLLLGSYGGSFAKFLKERLRSPSRHD
jgi:sodium transport system permease protein